MRNARFCGSLLLIAWVVGVQAHAHLEQAVPADNSVTGSAPTALVLHFSESTRLTALTIQKDGGPRQKLAPPDKSQPKITVPLPALTPGHYTVSWRALSADGHVVPGQLRFTFKL